MEGFYINLKHRSDRKKDMEKYINKYSIFKKIKRFDAITNNYGALGCALSHIECLKLLMEKEDDFFIILEDDFFILKRGVFRDFCNDFEKIKNKKWDILLLTPLGLIVDENIVENFHKINYSQTTSGYIVKKNYIPKLISCFIESSFNLEKFKNHKNRFFHENKWAIDQNWKKLQKEDMFIRYKYIFAGQKPGKSDIGSKYVNYNMFFLNQEGYYTE